MQVTGLCRFSYPAEGGFQVEHGSAEARMAYLYAPARMEARLRQFETICLPGLRAQTDPDFTLLVLIGDTLPARYRNRLSRAARRHSAGPCHRAPARPAPSGLPGRVQRGPRRPRGALPPVPP